MIWQVIHEGGTVECQTEEHAKEQAAKLSGSRVVELAPVDPLERAVVEAAVSWYRGGPASEEGPHEGIFWRAVDALVAARKEGT